MDFLKISLWLFMVMSSVSIRECKYVPKYMTPDIRRSNSDFNENCFCFKTTGDHKKVTEILNYNKDDLQRIVVYFYKDNNSGQVKLYIPNEEKQALVPDLAFEVGDKLNIVDDDNTLKYIFSPSSSGKGAQVHEPHLHKVYPHEINEPDTIQVPHWSYKIPDIVDDESHAEISEPDVYQEPTEVENIQAKDVWNTGQKYFWPKNDYADIFKFPHKNRPDYVHPLKPGDFVYPDNITYPVHHGGNLDNIQYPTHYGENIIPDGFVYPINIQYPDHDHHGKIPGGFVYPDNIRYPDQDLHGDNKIPGRLVYPDNIQYPTHHDANIIPGGFVYPDNIRYPDQDLHGDNKIPGRLVYPDNIQYPTHHDGNIIPGGFVYPDKFQYPDHNYNGKSPSRFVPDYIQYPEHDHNGKTPARFVKPDNIRYPDLDLHGNNRIPGGLLNPDNIQYPEHEHHSNNKIPGGFVYPDNIQYPTYHDENIIPGGLVYPDNIQYPDHDYHIKPSGGFVNFDNIQYPDHDLHDNNETTGGLVPDSIQYPDHGHNGNNEISSIEINKPTKENTMETIEVIDEGTTEETNKEIDEEPIQETNEETNDITREEINKVISGETREKTDELTSNETNETSEETRVKNNDYETFDRWFIQQMQRFKSFSEHDKIINLTTIERYILKILRDNDMHVTSEGVLTDSFGTALDVHNLNLRPILIGNTLEFGSLLEEKAPGLVFPADMAYLQGILVTNLNPSMILGIIPIGKTLIPPSTANAYSTIIKPYIHRNPDYSSKPISHNEIKVQHKGFIGHSSNPIILHLAEARPGRKKSKETVITVTKQTPILVKSIQRHRHREPWKVVGTRLIAGDKEFELSHGSAEAINKLIFSLKPVNDPIQNAEATNKLLASLRNKVPWTKPLEENNLEVEVSDEDIEGRIVGGSAATSSGTPLSLKGRMKD